jgi:uncharacterized coiled-coil protein SlyX
MEIEERIVSLEIKIAYLENSIGELNQAILAQEKTIKRLISENETIKKQIEDKKDSLPENEKPPHY